MEFNAQLVEQRHREYLQKKANIEQQNAELNTERLARRTRIAEQCKPHLSTSDSIQTCHSCNCKISAKTPLWRRITLCATPRGHNPYFDAEYTCTRCHPMEAKQA